MNTGTDQNATREFARSLIRRWALALVVTVTAVCVVLIFAGRASQRVQTATERVADVSVVRSSALQTALLAEDFERERVPRDEAQFDEARQLFEEASSRIIEMPPRTASTAEMTEFAENSREFMASAQAFSDSSRASDVALSDALDEAAHGALIETTLALENRYKRELDRAVSSHLYWLISAGGLFLLSAIGSGLFLVRPAVREIKEHVAERASQATQQAVRLFDNSVALLAILNRDLEIVRTNPSASELLGKSNDDLAGTNLLDTIVESDREKVAHLLQPAQKGDAVVDFECRIVTSDQTKRYLMWRATSPADDERIYLAAMDVTVAHRLRESLNERNQELSRSNEALDEFAYVASHDLRAPLRDIENLSGWILEDAGDLLPEASAGHLRKLRQRAERMETLLVDLLEYSRAGRVQPSYEMVDLEPLVEVAIELSNIPQDFTVETDIRAAPFEAPAARVKQVVMNLIGNAVKHHDRSDGTLKIEAFDDDVYVVIRVSDDGPGIEEDYHERVFELFRTTRPASDEGRGAGVGLALIRKIVEAHDGTVSLESTPGEGATFTVKWPRPSARRAEEA